MYRTWAAGAMGPSLSLSLLRHQGICFLYTSLLCTQAEHAEAMAAARAQWEADTEAKMQALKDAMRKQLVGGAFR